MENSFLLVIASRTFSHNQDPKRTFANRPKARLSSPIGPMLVAVYSIARPTTWRSVTHAVMTTNAENTELDNDTRLEKRT